MTIKNSFAFLVLSQIIIIGTAQADYFDDQNNTKGRYRTDYDSQTEGSSQNPLDIGTCLYPSPSDPVPLIQVHPTQRCPTSPTVYPGGPYPSSSVPFTSNSFFVVTANVELSFSTTTLPGGIQGAPNLSTSLTGSPDLMNLAMLPVFSYLGAPNPSYYRVSFLVDNEGSSGPKFASAIPFLAIGGQDGRGNAGNVGRMNTPGAPAITTWKSTVNMATATGGDTNYHFILAIAEWGGKPRMLFVNLFHFMTDWSSSSSPGLHRHWNWPASKSFYFPGADIALIDAEDIVTHCGSGVGTVPRITSLGVKTSYSLNWEALYRCASNKGLFDTPMPTYSVPLKGVHWGVELFGDAALFVIVELMQMTI